MTETVDLWTDERMEDKVGDIADAPTNMWDGTKSRPQTTLGLCTKWKASKKTKKDPLTLIEEDFDKIRETIQKVIEDVWTKVEA